MVNIEADIVDANFDNNLPLGRNWIYGMHSIVSSLLPILCFPHEGEIYIVDHIDYSLKDSIASSDSIVPSVKNNKHLVENIGVRMYSSLMCIFHLLSLIARINSISSSKAPSRREFFKTHYFPDPCPLPSSTTTLEEGKVGGMVYHMSAIEISYQFIVNTANYHPTPLSREDLHGDVALSWTINSTSSMDFLDTVFPYEEAILEVMMSVERPWDDLHHQSYLLLELCEVELSFSSLPSTGDVHTILNPLAPVHIFCEGNMSNILEIILVSISGIPIYVQCSHQSLVFP